MSAPVINRGIKRLVAGKGAACPICGNDHGCAVRPDGSAVFCIRVKEGCAVHRDGTPITLRDNMGWLHVLDGKTRTKARASVDRVRSSKQVKPLTPADCEELAKRFRNAMTQRVRADIGTDLGVSESALQRMDTGFDEMTRCATFPMFDGLRRMIGFRRRFKDGAKIAMSGSRNGLFIPKDLELYGIPEGVCDGHPQILLVPEGPTDVMAALDFGFRAIGRPNNAAGGDHLMNLLQRGKKQEVLIVADRDPTKYLRDGTPHWPGWEGALAIASLVVGQCGTLRVMKPPGKAKDLRQWKIEGGAASDLMAEVLGAEFVDHAWIKRQLEEIAAWKLRLKRKAG